MKKILCRLICAFVFVGAVATASDAQSDKPAVLKEVKGTSNNRVFRRQPACDAVI
jgi:hypothetical protein